MSIISFLTKQIKSSFVPKVFVLGVGLITSGVTQSYIISINTYMDKETGKKIVVLGDWHDRWRGKVEPWYTQARIFRARFKHFNELAEKPHKLALIIEACDELVKHLRVHGTRIGDFSILSTLIKKYISATDLASRADGVGALSQTTIIPGDIRSTLVHDIGNVLDHIRLSFQRSQAVGQESCSVQNLGFNCMVKSEGMSYPYVDFLFKHHTSSKGKEGITSKQFHKHIDIMGAFCAEQGYQEFAENLKCAAVRAIPPSDELVQTLVPNAIMRNVIALEDIMYCQSADMGFMAHLARALKEHDCVVIQCGVVHACGINTLIKQYYPACVPDMVVGIQNKHEVDGFISSVDGLGLQQDAQPPVPDLSEIERVCTTIFGELPADSPLSAQEIAQKVTRLCSVPHCESFSASHCAACKTQKYCSVECQKADWPVHKKVCKKK